MSTCLGLFYAERSGNRVHIFIFFSGINFWDEALRISDYCLDIYCYFHNVSADMFSGLLQVFVELGNLHGTSSFIWSTGVTCSDSVVYHNRVQALSIPVLLLAFSQDWTCNLQIIVSLGNQRYVSCWTIQSEFLGLKKLMFLLDKNYYYHVWFLPVLIFRFFFSSSLPNYRFPYCIQLYTWSTQQVIVAQHMCWFLKASNPPMFSPINYFNFIPFFVLFFYYEGFFCTQSYRKRTISKKINLTPWGDPIRNYQSEPRRNSNEGLLHIP